METRWLLVAGLMLAAAAPPAGSVPAGPEAKFIVVHPFVSAGNSGADYFGAGFADELRDRMARLPGLRVASRNRTLLFGGQPPDDDPASVLDGTLARANERLRIEARLIDRATATVLWSGRYERPLEAVFAVQDDILRQVLAALESEPSPSAASASRPAAIAAYDHYLNGRYHFLKSSRAALDRAEELLTRAVAADPDYAAAHAWLAKCHAEQFRAHRSDPRHLERADVLSARAVQLAPDQAQARLARGLALTVGERYPEAEREFEAASRLEPGLAEAHYYAGIAAFQQGRFEQTAARWERSIEFDPADKRVWRLLPQVYRSLGREDDARRAYAQVAVILERSLEAEPEDVHDWLSLATARLALGEREAALASAERILGLAGDDASALYNAACLYALAGESDRALDALERSHRAGLADPEWMARDSDLESVREHPRFVALLERMRAARATSD